MKIALRDSLEERIFDELSKMTVLDAHEHLRPEAQFVIAPADFAWFMQYVINDIVCCGLGEPSSMIYDPEITSAEKWRRLQPFWPQVKRGQFARIMLLALREWFGVEDLNDETVRHLDREVRKSQRPGIYREALADKCRIARVISNARTWVGYDHDFLKVIVNIPHLTCQREVRAFEQVLGQPIRTAAQFREALRDYVRKAVAAGCVGFKTVVFPVAPVPADIEDLVGRMIAEPAVLPSAQIGQLVSYCHHQCLEAIRGTGAVMAVHVGTYGNGTSHPVNFFPLIEAYPEVRFDLFHMGFPYMRETGLLAKDLPNVVLNLNGCALTSQHMFEAGAQEYLDFVPSSKIIGFGGDYQWMPQLVWGHWQVMKESYARIFADRIRRQMIDFDGAVEVLRQWMWDNPKRIYQI